MTTTPFDAQPNPAPATTYDTIAAQVRAMAPREIPADKFDDVLVILEWMRDQCLTKHQANVKRDLELTKREDALQAGERSLAIRSRAVDAALRTQPARRSWGFLGLRGVRA